MPRLETALFMKSGLPLAERTPRLAQNRGFALTDPWHEVKFIQMFALNGSALGIHAETVVSMTVDCRLQQPNPKPRAMKQAQTRFRSSLTYQI